MVCTNICFPARVGKKQKYSKINLNWVYPVVYFIEKMALFNLLSYTEQELSKIRGMEL